jgi:hypothetical protein
MVFSKCANTRYRFTLVGNDGIGFPMACLFTVFNMLRPLIDINPAGNFSFA